MHIYTVPEAMHKISDVEITHFKNMKTYNFLNLFICLNYCIYFYLYSFLKKRPYVVSLMRN